MQRNFRLIIEYDGTEFQGWQVQPDARTVQEEIQRAIGVMTRERITLVGSGRTDAGVHALGMSAHFHCDTRITAEEFFKGLNEPFSGNISPRPFQTLYENQCICPTPNICICRLLFG